SLSFWVGRKFINIYGDGPEKLQELGDDKLSFTFQKKDRLYFKFDEESFGLDNIIRNKGCDTWVLREFKFRLKYKKDVLSEHAG
ncbi:6377_t:CDS:2, partial [Dentiscutata heterogama]